MGKLYASFEVVEDRNDKIIIYYGLQRVDGKCRVYMPYCMEKAKIREPGQSKKFISDMELHKLDGLDFLFDAENPAWYDTKGKAVAAAQAMMSDD